MVEEYDYLFKTIVVGDGGVGKTALTIRFSKDFFTEDYKMTIGVDFHVKTISTDTSEGPLRCKLQIWDTGGQERFSSIRPMYYRGSLGALVIYDLTNYESFEHLPQWIEEIRTNIKNEIPLLLVGNKSDLTEQRAVNIEEINEFTEKFNLYYMETSAKTGDGVGDCFQVLAGLMIGSGVPNKFISDGTVYGPRTLLRAPTTKPVHDITAPPAPEPGLKLVPEPAPLFEPEPVHDITAPPVPSPSLNLVPEPAPSFESEAEIDFAAPPVPEPQPKKVISPAPIFEPEPEIKYIAPPVPELSKKEDPKSIIPSVPSPEATAGGETYKPRTVPFSQKGPVPAPAPEGFRLTKALEISGSSSKAGVPFIPTTPSQSSNSDSLFDYMPEATLTKKEKKELEKQKKLEEKERQIREAKEEKEAARLEKERKTQEETEIKEAARLEKERKNREAKEEKERKIREAKEEKEAARLEKERKAQEEKDAKEAAKLEKKKGKEVFEPPNMFQTTSPPAKTTEESSLFSALTQKPGDSPKNSLFTPFTASEKSESTKLRIIPNVTDIDSFTNPLPPVPTIQDKSSMRGDTIMCKQCGAVLSSDYAFCNKCGSAL